MGKNLRYISMLSHSLAVFCIRSQNFCIPPRNFAFAHNFLCALSQRYLRSCKTFEISHCWVCTNSITGVLENSVPLFPLRHACVKSWCFLLLLRWESVCFIMMCASLQCYYFYFHQRMVNFWLLVSPCFQGVCVAARINTLGVINYCISLKTVNGYFFRGILLFGQ